MRKLIFFTLIVQALGASAQPGFIKTYGFEQEQITGSAFANILLDNDTLVLFGTCYPPVTPPGQQALLFVKMDTLGNVLMHKCHLDPDAPSDEYVAASNYEMIKTSDGGYAMVGANLSTDNGLFIKLSHEGDIEFYRKYGAEIERDVSKVLELADGYFLSGWKQLQNYDTQVFLMRVDKQGNFLWEKTYGQTGVIEVPGSFIMIDDNHFAIGAGKAKGLADPPFNSNDTWAKAWLIEVDSLGNIINTTESQPNVQTGLGGLKRLPDGWLYTSAIFELHNQFEFGTRGTIVRTGENINDVLWERTVGTSSTWLNGMMDVKATPDGNWVAVGQWAKLPLPPETWLGYLGGSTYKFTSEGDSLWARLDTAFWNPDCGSENYLGGVAVLPSGSVFAAGYANSNCFPPTPRSYGWVLKISNDGCIDTLCVTTDLIFERHSPKLIVYPNPTFGELSISGCDNCEAEIYDAFGRMVQKKQINNLSLDMSLLADGAYWLKIINKNNIQIEKIIKCR